MTRNNAENTPSNSRGLIWAAFAFYALIAFEFFYMASPFAAYFYSAYGPGMDWLQALPLANWTLWFFLPHVVADTKSGFINAALPLGLILFIGGLSAFAVGAFQVYRAKLMKRGAVTAGVYRHIRHPQYTALIIASMGMMLIWPRFLVLFSTACVVLVYFLLARHEERLCQRQFPDYGDYMTRTGMFFPRISRSKIATEQTSSSRWVIIALAFMGITAIATIGAFGIRSVAIESLYKIETDNGIFLSVSRIGEDDLGKLAHITMTDPDVRMAINAANADGQLLAYVLPTQMYVSEIPMHLPAGKIFGHTIPGDADPSLWKVVLTKAEFAAGDKGSNILEEAVNKSPSIELHVDLKEDRIFRRFPPPATPFYNGRQVPIF